mmetsp:Transcript_2592/g.6192  ORF Transcript_2592/g.6192 Transcript_2592/m.6192 type:complete len:231 (+) Transcript_2592:763-1455(+)
MPGDRHCIALIALAALAIGLPIRATCLVAFMFAHMLAYMFQYVYMATACWACCCCCFISASFAARWFRLSCCWCWSAAAAAVWSGCAAEAKAWGLAGLPLAPTPTALTEEALLLLMVAVAEVGPSAAAAWGLGARRFCTSLFCCTSSWKRVCALAPSLPPAESSVSLDCDATLGAMGTSLGAFGLIGTGRSGPILDDSISLRARVCVCVGVCAVHCVPLSLPRTERDESK